MLQPSSQHSQISASFGWFSQRPPARILNPILPPLSASNSVFDRPTSELTSVGGAQANIRELELLLLTRGHEAERACAVADECVRLLHSKEKERAELEVQLTTSQKHQLALMSEDSENQRIALEAENNRLSSQVARLCEAEGVSERRLQISETLKKELEVQLISLQEADAKNKLNAEQERQNMKKLEIEIEARQESKLQQLKEESVQSLQAMKEKQISLEERDAAFIKQLEELRELHEHAACLHMKQILASSRRSWQGCGKQRQKLHTMQAIGEKQKRRWQRNLQKLFVVWPARRQIDQSLKSM